MNRESPGTLMPDFETKCRFGVNTDSSFVFSEDGQYVIGLDAGNLGHILVEHLAKGPLYRLNENQIRIHTLFFEGRSGTLLSGDDEGHLVQYRLDLENGSVKKVKDHGYLGFEIITSISAFEGLVFFGGLKSRCRALDLASDSVLPGHVDTAVGRIKSLEVCAVKESGVFLAVVGKDHKYSPAKSDLFALGSLLGKASVSGEVLNDPKLLLTKSTRNTLCTQNRYIEVLLERIQILANSLGQKNKKEETQERKEKELKEENRKLKRENASLKKKVSVLSEDKRELKAKAEKTRKKLVKKFAKRPKRENEAKEMLESLRSKLRILGATGRGRRPGNLPGQPDPAEVIRDLRDQLSVKTSDYADINKVIKITLRENTTLEEKLEAKAKELGRTKWELGNAKAANREG